MNIKSQRNCLSLLMETNFKHLNSHQQVLLSQAGTDESLEINPSEVSLGLPGLLPVFSSHVPFLAGSSSLRNLSLFINALCSVTMAMLKESVMAKQDHKRIIFIFILGVSTNKQINKCCQQPESHWLLGKQLAGADSILHTSMRSVVVSFTLFPPFVEFLFSQIIH